MGLWLRAITLKELAQEAELSNYRGVGTVIQNFERRLNDDPMVLGAAHDVVKLMTCETIDPGD